MAIFQATVISITATVLFVLSGLSAVTFAEKIPTSAPAQQAEQAKIGPIRPDEILSRASDDKRRLSQLMGWIRGPDPAQDLYSLIGDLYISIHRLSGRFCLRLKSRAIIRSKIKSMP